MSRFRLKFKYSGKEFDLYPYNTEQEKDILLAKEVTEISLDSILHICGVEDDVVNSLTRYEKIGMIYKIREISVGEEIAMKYKCSYCGHPNENVLTISEVIQPSNLDVLEEHGIVDLFEPVTDLNLKDFVPNVDIDEMDVDEFEKLENIVKENVTKFNIEQPINCLKCKKPSYMNIGDVGFIADNMSEDSLQSMFLTYNDMVFFGKYSKHDIDTMYPYERTILTGLIRKTLGELNNG